MERAWRLLLLGMGIGATCGGCASSGAARDKPEAIEVIPIQKQVSGTHSSVTRPMQVVARNRETLAKLALADVPIDFDTQQALVVTLGLVPSDDVAVRVAKVWRQGSRIRVTVIRTRSPCASRRGIRAASPFTIAVIPRSDLVVEGFSTYIPKRGRR